MDESLALFYVLYDRPLVKKVLDIARHLIQRMRQKPNLYGANEVEGIQLGVDLIAEGDRIFQGLSGVERDLLFDFVIAHERKIIAEIFGA